MSYSYNAKRKYCCHRNRAKRSGIEWELTYIKWYTIWVKSGHWHERGRKRGQYVMARYGDKGPYSEDNVKIITTSENLSEWDRNIEYRSKISKAGRDRVFTPDHRRKIGNAHLGMKRSIETRLKMSLAKIGNKYALGYKQSPEHCRNTPASAILLVRMLVGYFNFGGVKVNYNLLGDGHDRPRNE